MTAFLTKDARRAIINRCATHLSARFAGRAFVVAAFTNDVSPVADPSCLPMGEGALTVQTVGAPAFDHSFHANPISTGAQ